MAKGTEKSKEILKTNPAAAKSAKALVTLADSYNSELQKTILHNTELKDLAKELESSWGDLSKVLLSINDKSSKLNKNFGFVEDVAKDIVDSMNDIGSELYTQVDISEKIKKIQKEQGKRLSEFKKAHAGLNELIQDEKKLEEEKDTLSKYQYDRKLRQLKVEREIKENALAQLKADQQAGAFAIQALVGLEETAKAMDIANEHAKKLGFNLENATRTVTGKLEKSFDFLEEVPFLSDVLGLDSIKENLEKNVKASLVKSMTEGKGAASSMFSAMVAGARSLIATMAPLLPLILAAYAVYKAFEFDKELTQFSKDLDVSKDTAMGLSIEADAIAGSLGVAGVNGVEVGKAMATVKDSMGATAALANKELVGAVSLLQTRIGLSGEEAMALNSTATILGTNLNDLAASSYDMADGLIGGKAMLKEMAKLPKSLVVGFKGTTKELQKAIVKGKLFGLTIEQAQKAGEGMLDIEQSLEKEMTFNILAGKNMNLNKARQLALEGKTAELQDEILNQAGSLSEFQKMGPMQQKAMADALNMSKEELTEMLTKTQEMADVGLSQAAVEEQMKLSLEDQQSTIDSMTDEKKKAYLQDLLNKKKQEEATAKFNDSMTKLTEAFQKTMMPVVELLGEALGYVGDIIHWFTVGIEKLNHWIHSLTGAKEELKEGEGVMSSILSWAAKIGGAILLWNVGKKALGGMAGMVKNMIPGMGGSKATEAASSATGSADQLKGAKEGKNKVSQLLDGIKNIIDSIKGVVQSAIQFVRDVGKDLINTVKDLFNGVVDLVRSVGTNVLSTLQELVKGIGNVLSEGTDIIVNVGSKLAEGAMKILNIIIQGLGKAAGQLPAIMSALGSAVVAFFTPMAALVPLAPAIAIFTGAMIGLGFAFKLLGEGIGAAAPGIQAFFDGMGGVIEAVGNAIAKVVETITTSIIRLQDIDPTRLMGVAGGIASVGFAIAGFGAGAGAGGVMSAIGSFFDEDPVEKFNRFATIDSAKLVEVAGAIDKLGDAIAKFSSQVGKIGEVSGIIDTIDKVMELHDAVSENPISEAVEGVASAVGDIFAKAASFVTSAPAEATVNTSAGAGAQPGAAVAQQGSMKEVADLLKQLITVTSQPVKINIGGKVIDEIEKQTTLRKTYNTKMDTAHGAFG
jgi:phage-related protein